MATTTRRKPTRAELRRQRMQMAVEYPLDWLEERSGLIGGVRYFLFRKVPSDTNWMQTLGSATFTAFIVQAITGVILAMYYRPTPEGAYSSIQDITDHVFMGWLVRGMHRWGASVFIILMFLHMGGGFGVCGRGRERLHHPHVPAHGSRVPVRRVQVPARAELDRRRPAARDGDDGRLHWL